MSSTWTAVVAALPPLLVALTAWLRAEAAHRKLAGKQDKPVA